MIWVKPDDIEGIIQKKSSYSPSLSANRELPCLNISQLVSIKLLETVWFTGLFKRNSMPTIFMVLVVEEVNGELAIAVYFPNQIHPEFLSAVIERELRVCRIQMLE